MVSDRSMLRCKLFLATTKKNEVAKLRMRSPRGVLRLRQYCPRVKRQYRRTIHSNRRPTSRRRCRSIHMQSLVLGVRDSVVQDPLLKLHRCTLLEMRKWSEVEEANFKESGLQSHTNLCTLLTKSHRRERIWLQFRDLVVLNLLLRLRCAVIVLGSAIHLHSSVASPGQRCRSLVARAPLLGVLVYFRSFGLARCAYKVDFSHWESS